MHRTLHEIHQKIRLQKINRVDQRRLHHILEIQKEQSRVIL